jgi:HPt (histidine-containing phosphotransfer) domain-containing protein
MSRFHDREASLGPSGEAARPMTTTNPPPMPEATSRRSLHPALDEKKLRELEALKPAVRSRVLRAYRRDAPTVMSVIERALEERDAAGVRDGAHRLSSSSAAIGATRLAELYGTLERTARLGVLGDTRSIVTDLRAELQRVLYGLSRVGEG